MLCAAERRGFVKLCCLGGECDGGGACVAGQCVACGGALQPCCPGGVCPSAGQACDGSSCVACGTEGAPCCDDHTCNASDLLCNANSGRCEHCGDADERCCVNRACNDGGCCDTNSCTPAGEACFWADNAVCGDSSCGSCGNLDEPCCAPFDFCTAPNLDCDGSNTGQGVVCNAGDSECTRCGAPGEPCCPGRVCEGGGCCLESSTCAASGDSCGLTGFLCDAGMCRDGTQLCGGLFQPAKRGYGRRTKAWTSSHSCRRYRTASRTATRYGDQASRAASSRPADSGQRRSRVVAQGHGQATIFELGTLEPLAEPVITAACEALVDGDYLSLSLSNVPLARRVVPSASRK